MTTAAEVWGYRPASLSVEEMSVAANVQSAEIYTLHGLDVDAPLTDDTGSRQAGSLSLVVTGAGGTASVERLP